MKMEEGLVKRENSGLANQVPYKSLEDFTMFLNSEPDKKDIKVNKQVQARPDGTPVRYLPIGVVQRTLDQVFNGLWSVVVTDIRVVANEIGYTVNLKVYHPIIGEWLERAGTGWCQIRMKSGSEVIDVSQKHKVALTADAPHAYSEAIKNAAKQYGVKFGRNLNRDDDYLEYETLTEMTISEDIYDEIQGMLDACETEEDLKSIKKQYKEYTSDLRIRKLLLKKFTELQKNQ